MMYAVDNICSSLFLTMKNEVRIQETTDDGMEFKDTKRTEQQASKRQEKGRRERESKSRQQHISLKQ